MRFGDALTCTVCIFWIITLQVVPGSRVVIAENLTPQSRRYFILNRYKNVNTEDVSNGRRRASRRRMRGVTFPDGPTSPSGHYLSGQYHNVTDAVSDGRHRAPRRRKSTSPSDHYLIGQYSNVEVPDAVSNVKVPDAVKNITDGVSNVTVISNDKLPDVVSNVKVPDAVSNVTDSVERHVASRRLKRSVVQLASMLRCVTGCSPLAYKGYGCYCGYMGSGLPVDEIDRCCLEHDWCYTHIACPQLLVYFVPYRWTCAAPGYPQCEIAAGSGLPAECALQLCECDRQFAKCVRNFPCPKYKAICQSQGYLTNVIMSGK